MVLCFKLMQLEDADICICIFVIKWQSTPHVHKVKRWCYVYILSFQFVKFSENLQNTWYILIYLNLL